MRTLIELQSKFTHEYLHDKEICTIGKNSYLKHSIYFLSHTLMVHIRVRKFSHQLVYSCHDVRHFLPCDATVAIDVVKGKRPAQLLVDGTTRQYAETSNEVLQHRNKIGLCCIRYDISYIEIVRCFVHGQNIHNRERRGETIKRYEMWILEMSVVR